MRVIVSRTGGIAGMRRSWQVRTEDQPDAPDWIVLIRALPWDELQAAPPLPDRFVYRIRIERPADPEEQEQFDAGLRDPGDPVEREATLAEQQLNGLWRELVDRVQAADRPEPTDADGATGTRAG